MAKQTSHQRRAVDRGEYTKIFAVRNGQAFPRRRPPRTWYMGDGYARQNRTVETWPWPGDPTRYTPSKRCVAVACPSTQDVTFTNVETNMTKVYEDLFREWHEKNVGITSK